MSKFSQAHKPLTATLNSRTGVIRLIKLMPLARAAVNSWSALKRPKTSSAAVSMPMGSEKASTYGISKQDAVARPRRGSAWRLISRLQDLLDDVAQQENQREDKHRHTQRRQHLARQV